MRMTATHRAWPTGFLLTLALSAAVALGQEAPPAIVIEPPKVMALADCIHAGLEHQPSLTAARASLAAALDNRTALEDLRMAAVLNHELPIRRKQAQLGVVIGQAGVEQAEWETTYAVTRNYYTALFARAQLRVASGLVEKLKTYREQAERLVKKGDPDVKLTTVDVDKLAVNIDLFQLRVLQASEGIERARAALREAMGLPLGCCFRIVEEDLPALEENLCLSVLVDMALARRGELVQAGSAAEVTALEVEAQEVAHGLTARTFAAVSDIHSRQIPQGVANKEYRPSAIGLDMPTTLAGHKRDRVQRAQDLSSRAAAVVEKTRNLIALEAEDAFFKWREAAGKLRVLKGTFAAAERALKSTEARWESGFVSGEDILRAKTLEAQVRAEFNDALYQHALALAALERITAGGYRIGRHAQP
jgi:outer membrane protein TolC